MTAALLPAAVRAAVSAGYNLGLIIAESRLSTGPFSAAYRLDTESGSYCLKLHSKDRSAGALKLEEELLTFLARQRFPLTPALVPTASGNPHLRAGQEICSLYSYIEADPPFDWSRPAWSAGHCRAAGRALAAFHRATAPFVARLRNEQRYRPFCLPLRSMLPSRFRRSLDFARQARRGHNEALALVAEESESLGDALASTLAALNRLESERSATPVLIHGDYHPGNVLFRGQELCGILDFEYLRVEDRRYDLGCALIHFCALWPAGRAKQPPSSGFERAFDRRRLEAFQDGYLEGAGAAPDRPQTPLPAGGEEGISTLVPYMKFACFLLVCWLVELYQGGSRSRPDFLDRAVFQALTMLRALQSVAP